ncbi:MAG: fructosamine kinase family protein [Acidimicrobiia bacterium]|nr:fructosamine kinase family protein [Acidimicrobiia bacterium]
MSTRAGPAGSSGPPDWLVDAVSTVLGVQTRVATPVHGGDIAAAFRVDTSDGPLFAKATTVSTDDVHGPRPDRAAVEAADLRWLTEAGALRIPAVLGHGRFGDRSVLLLEWIDQGTPGADHDARLGTGLAALHAAGAESFGSTRPGGFGSLALSNEPCGTWAEFFAARRLLPLVRTAEERGLLSRSDLAAAEAIAEGLADPAIGGPSAAPARVHGDLWAGNALVDDRGRPVLIDPAAHGAHREVDLAMMQLFGGFSSRVFAAYDEASPLADGWQRRCRLWQIAPLCVHALLFGGSYVEATAARLAECRP